MKLTGGLYVEHVPTGPLGGGDHGRVGRSVRPDGRYGAVEVFACFGRVSEPDVPRREVLVVVVPHAVAWADDKPILRGRKTSLGHTAKKLPAYVDGLKACTSTTLRICRICRAKCVKNKIGIFIITTITLCY